MLGPCLDPSGQECHCGMTRSQGWTTAPHRHSGWLWVYTYLFLAFFPTVLSVRLRHHPVNLRKKKNSFPQVPFSLHTEVREEEKVL